VKLPADGRDKQESAGKVKAMPLSARQSLHFIFA
jgi:hypothetical protein